MDLLYTPVGVLLILAVVALAAFKFQPSQYPGKWQLLVDWFGATSQPVNISHPEEPVEVSGPLMCNVTLEPDGMWLQQANADGFVLFIPWPHFKLKRQSANSYQFSLKKDAATRKIIDMTVLPELGAAMVRRIPERPEPQGAQ